MGIPDQRTFVRTIRNRLGLSPTELGNRLGKPNGYAAVNSWETTNAKNYRGLGYEDTMALLQLAGWLNMRGELPVPVDPLEELGDAAHQIVENQEALIERIDLLLERAGVGSLPLSVPAVPTP